MRDQSPFFQRYQDHWLSKILPIVAAHQISRGGNVIFLQLENEGSFWGAWTREHPNNDPYWKHLHDLAIENGIEIPFFMSGMHHGFIPLPNDTDSSTRVNPWYATEIWTGWYDAYGSSKKDIYFKALNFMTSALALGANGFNYYMLHGGSNFDYWNNNEDASTYDYGAAIGQAGDLRPMYYTMKQYNTFASSFADILENATGDMADYQSFVTDGYLRGVRKSPQGTIVFIQGSASLHKPPTVQGVGGGIGGPIDLSSLEVAGIVLDAPLAPGIEIIEAATPILGVAHQGNTTTLVVYGKAGDKGMLTLALGNSKKQLEIDYPSGEPSETFEQVGGERLRVLALSSDLVPLTWFIGKKGDQSIVVGSSVCG